MSELKYPTPHINAHPEDIAETVLMPGDPQRAEFVAKNFLQDAKLFNNVRGVQGYTGIYKEKRISVMASGMGMPSIGIYSYELFNFFGVNNIIRIGSAGAMSEKLKLRDIVLAMGACTNSAFAAQYHLPGTFAPIASYSLLRTAEQTAFDNGITPFIGNVLSSDTFYDDDPTANAKWRRLGVLAVEMEAAALYMNAARAGKNALAVLTVSDHLITGESTTAEERRSTFTEMVSLALETAIKL